MDKKIESNDVNSSGSNVHTEALFEFLKYYWKKRVVAILIVIIFSIAGVAYALLTPNLYTAKTVLSPAAENSNGSLSGLASQYGGLAAMAGIDLAGGEGNKTLYAIEYVKSWPFWHAFMDEHKLKPYLIAAKSWKRDTNTILFDSSLYDSESQEWIQDLDGESVEPLSTDVYKKVLLDVGIDLDSDNGLLTMTYTHLSPQIAADILEKIVKDLNSHFSKKDKNAAKDKIAFLTKQLDNTTNTELQKMFYQMIEGHTKKLVMTSSQEEYLFQTLVPILTPEKKSKPRRSIICIIGGVLGIFISILSIYIRFYIRSQKSKLDNRQG